MPKHQIIVGVSAFGSDGRGEYFTDEFRFGIEICGLGVGVDLEEKLVHLVERVDEGVVERDGAGCWC